jgi:hypothetical protein
MKKNLLIFVSLICVLNTSHAEWIRYNVPESPKEAYFYDNVRIIKNQKIVAVWEKNNLNYFGYSDGMKYKSTLRRLLIDCSTYKFDVSSIRHYSEIDLKGAMNSLDFDGKNFTDIPINSPEEILAGIVCKK